MRVRDWRIGQIAKLPDARLHLHSRLEVADVLMFSADAVRVATGARWRTDGVGRYHTVPALVAPRTYLLAPDDVMADRLPEAGPMVICDDFYLAGVLAEKLRGSGFEVHLVTPEALVSSWTRFTLEQKRMQRRPLQLNVILHSAQAAGAASPGEFEPAFVFTQRRAPLACARLVPVTARNAEDRLCRELLAAAAGRRAAQERHAPARRPSRRAAPRLARPGGLLV